MATPIDFRPRKWTKPGPTGAERAASWARQQAAVAERLGRLPTRPRTGLPSSREWARGLELTRTRIDKARAALARQTG